MSLQLTNTVAQELREARGQLLDINALGEVRDVSPNVSLSTRAPTLTRSGRMVKKPDNPDFEHDSGDEVYEITGTILFFYLPKFFYSNSTK